MPSLDIFNLCTKRLSDKWY